MSSASLALRSTGAVVFDGVKSVPLESLPEEAWRIVAGKAGDGIHEPDDGAITPERAYQTVPWVYRAVSLRAQALADLPWAVTRGDAAEDAPEVVTSEDYATVKGLEWLGGLGGLLYRTELSLCLSGAAYWQILANRAGVNKGYRWLASKTIAPKYDPAAGVVGFERRLGASAPMAQVFSPDELVWWWLPDPSRELGPGTSPVQAALRAAGLIRNVDAFSEGFFGRGAVNLTLLSVEGNPGKAELDRLEAWWKRLVAGVRSAWNSVAVRAAVKPVVLGNPPKDLAMSDLTEAKQKDIAVCLGVPFTLLFSEASNKATAEQDDLNFYTKCLLPEAEFVEATLNERVFRPQGLEFQFQPNKLELFEQRESEKAFALIAAVSAGVLTPNEWREQMDLEPMPEGDGLRAPTANPTFGSAREMQGDTAAANGASSGTGTNTGAGGGQGRQGAGAQQARRAWQTKALRAVKAGKPAAVAFTTDALDEDEQAAIRSALETATTPEEVKAAFVVAPFPDAAGDGFQGYP